MKRRLSDAKRRRRGSSWSRTPREVVFDERDLVVDICTEGRVLGLSRETVQPFAEKVAKKVGAWAKKRKVITEDDLNRKLGEELEKYDFNIAYVYKNRDKII